MHAPSQAGTQGHPIHPSSTHIFPARGCTGGMSLPGSSVQPCGDRSLSHAGDCQRSGKARKQKEWESSSGYRAPIHRYFSQQLPWQQAGRDAAQHPSPHEDAQDGAPALGVNWTPATYPSKGSLDHATAKPQALACPKAAPRPRSQPCHPSLNPLSSSSWLRRGPGRGQGCRMPQERQQHAEHPQQPDAKHMGSCQ